MTDKHEWSKKIIKEGCTDPDLIRYSLLNLRDPSLFDKFCETIAEYDKSGRTIDELIYSNWDTLFQQVKSELIKPVDFHHENSSKPLVMITFTTCKRFDLFQQTLNSILNTWTDINRIDYWFCVDDNSSNEDRQKMKKTYPWIDYYFKYEDEKGHRDSMNIIYNKLKKLQPKYWIHMEDDFLFFKKNKYVGIGIDFLENPSNTQHRQLLYNRSYGETIRDYGTRGFTSVSDDYCMHDYKEGRKFPYRNCHYWPHYSFRPSMIDPSVILDLGDFNTENQFFEMDYARKWMSKGYKSGFMNSINCKHIGKLTSEKNKDNAYTLNKESQFSKKETKEYKFSTSWFANSELKKNIHKYLEATQENHILEIGCFEGRSTCHFSDYYLEHPDSTMTCIDPFIGDNGTPQVDGGTREIFDTNIRLSKQFSKCKIHYDYSENVLPTIKETFNFIYIDGSHEPQDILADMRNTFPYLVKGGIMYMDDYLGGENHEIKKVIDQFINEHVNEVDVIFSGYQLGLKRRNPNYIKVVNLARRPDRKESIQSQLDKHGITNYEFINAVDGKKLKPTANLRDMFENNDFGSKVGVIGCALSHFGIWKALLADRTNDFYIVMEDDAELCDNFKAYLNKAIKSNIKSKELVFLSYLMFDTNSKKTEETYKKYQTDTEDPVLNFNKLNKSLYVGGTCLYSINKKGAQILCDFIFSYGIRHGIDYQMKITPNLDTYESQPMICTSEWNEGGTVIDTDIQCNTGSIDFSNIPQFENIKNRFIFIPGKDQHGNDLYFKKDTLNQMMQTALEDPNCVGFNTLGFFKSKLSEVSPSRYFGESDGFYIKKVIHNKTTKRVKMLCNWCDSKELCKEWSVMCNGKNNWGDIEITHADNDVDHYVIINYPRPGDYYDPKKTTIFQMEPWVEDQHKLWGVKTWGKWAIPDPKAYHKVFTHKNSLNCVQWQFKVPNKIDNTSRHDKVVCVLSKKIYDDGHTKRVDFVRSSMDGDLIHVYGRENYHSLSNYKGLLTNDSKETEFSKYKYCLSAENNSENNYATEKIWEPILCEALCFYWGCPNLEDYIDSKAFVRLDLDDKEGSMKIIKQAIEEDWWSQRLDIIKKEKYRIINELGFFPVLSNLIKKL